MSISYGFDEFDVTPAYAQRQCTEYAKLGILGTTVLYSSGDHGTGGQSGICLNSQNEPDINGTVFSNTFPGGCPFVTSVGGTQVNNGSTTADPESVWDQIFDEGAGFFFEASSGGGFSNIFRAPSYQAEVVKNYIEKFAPADANFNRTGVSDGFFCHLVIGYDNLNCFSPP